jgi:DNA gyrase subunit B
MDKKIVILKGAERVRRRPAVVFDDIGCEGAMSSVEKMIHIVASECVDGYSKMLEISVEADNVVCISNKGRGIWFGAPDATDDQIWKDMFCELYSGGKFMDLAPEGARYSIYSENCIAERRKWLVVDDSELYLGAIQYASAFMKVVSIRDGYEYRLNFERGENVGGLTKAQSTTSSGTQITFKPDPEVFGEYALSGSQIKEKAELIALANPGVTVKVAIVDEEPVTYCYPDGIPSYMEEHCDNEHGTPIFKNLIKGVGQDRYNYPSYNAQVEVGISFAPNQGYIKCLHNQRELTYGGTHVENLKYYIGRYIEYMLEALPSEEQLLKHLQMVVITYTDGIPKWENGSRLSIAHNVIRDMADDTIKEDFRYFLMQNVDVIENLFK